MKITHHPRKRRERKAVLKAEDSVEEEKKDLPICDVEESQDRKRKKHKTTEYFYLLERKAIRMMRRYYKESFEEFAKKYKYKQNLKRLDRPTVDKYFRDYVKIEFAANKESLDVIGSEQMIVSLETIILCDRYNKNERITDGLNFDEIRNLLNKYNSKNLKDFFANISHAFLFSHYFKLNSKKDVLDQKHVDEEKLNKQMESLFKKSIASLPDSIKASFAGSDC